ncbi:solute carrier organic anion transporter family member 5A1 [Orussus abietinus]|uniref:solute carrier organic anion transporter family member 5A1 n=1 Tax=Orussus abietinus TaxID=222816 RepID=UPI000C715CF6|nr:solute carrier organic anion transporter family member 5A1 [Orussus abietinus]
MPVMSKCKSSTSSMVGMSKCKTVMPVMSKCKSSTSSMVGMSKCKTVMPVMSKFKSSTTSMRVDAMRGECGLCGLYPGWLRSRANPRNFIAVYGLLGTVQAMAFIYIVVTLTTLEKRFKIPSRTTGFTFALRTVGPAIGFLLGYGCLSLYIDPSLHPVITKKDPRWLGAWWLGWIILGVTMSMFAVLIAMFPRHLPKSGTRQEISKDSGELPLKSDMQLEEKSEEKSISQVISEVAPEEIHVPTMKDFPRAMKRLLTNWLLTCNNLSAVFYVLGASAYITFLAKYLEVQYSTSAAGGTVIAGPISLVGMVLGFLLSGAVISKFKPGPRPLLAWNVLVGFCFVAGQIFFIFLGCADPGISGLNLETEQLNLTAACNVNCGCEGIKYAPVCHEPSGTTYYSACHAGCMTILDDKQFGNCSCVRPLMAEVGFGFGGRFELPGSGDPSHSWPANERVYLLPESSPQDPVMDKVSAGPCPSDCRTPYILFTVLTCIVQTLACSGKIGNVLINYRSVDKKDKSFAQGVTLMTISLFALIPGPIIYGAIIDSTCLIWEESCGTRGNCWFYHRDNFRFLVNVSAAGFSFLGVLFDIVVCYLGKDLDLYGALEDDGRRRLVKEDLPTILDTNQRLEVNGSANPSQRIERNREGDAQSAQ